MSAATSIAAVVPNAAWRAMTPTPCTAAIAARAYVLLDFNSGQFLQTHNPNERVEPASLTKLMTAYLTFAALRQKTLRPDQTVLVSTRSWRAEGLRGPMNMREPSARQARVETGGAAFGTEHQVGGAGEGGAGDQPSGEQSLDNGVRAHLDLIIVVVVILEEPLVRATAETMQASRPRQAASRACSG